MPDVRETVDFYVERLAFMNSLGWEDGGALIWAEVARGDARIWFFRDAQDRDSPTSLTGFLYIFMDDVDAEADRTRPHVDVVWGPEDMAHGLREIGFEDLNGYRLVFAKDM
ncbi:VOC family protein [Hyphobacterium sp.]|uniref:VOC family protein n=1 Tax=Hyphobacterium sp. TaxID=2004662 RepID=UPI003BAC8A1F